MIHELVHILKNNTAVCCDLFTARPGSQEEVFCNKIAGEVLVPKDHFVNYLNSNNYTVFDAEIISELSEKLSVRATVTARRLCDLNYISKNDYFSLPAFFKTKKQKQDISEPTSYARNMPGEIYDFNSNYLSKSILMLYSDDNLSN
jgi:Zn-dependent peptidase ImmA (M78 family)